jgi:hypothetical protein
MTPAEIALHLPPPRHLERLSLSLAALDAVMSPEWEYRYYSFDPGWSPTQRMASMRNGSGGQYFIVFDPVGTVVRAFDHESALSPWNQPDNMLAPATDIRTPYEKSSTSRRSEPRVVRRLI